MKAAVAASLLLLLADRRPLPPTLVAPPAAPTDARGVSFADVTRSAGLSAFHRRSGGAAKDYILEAKGGGLALLDADGDGALDVYLVNGATFDALWGREEAPPAALFRSNRDGTYTDVTDAAGVANRGWGQGACTGDYDNDGDDDLYVTNFGPNRLYRNDGKGRFAEVAPAAGVALGGWSTGCAFGDYDGDGRLDLFVAGYILLDLERLPPAPEGAPRARVAARDEAKAEGPGMQAPYRPGASSCRYRGQPAMCGPRGLKGAPDHLFRNAGDGTFTDVSVAAGVADPNGYYGIGVAFFDFDDDGRLDLFVANDSSPNHLYKNRGDGTFQDVSFASGAAFNEAGQEQAHMGVAVGDYDGDGRLDLHVTNFENDANILYHNEGGGLFSETTYPAGVGNASVPFVGWGTNFLDYDNDAWPDLLVANGHVYPWVGELDWNTSYEQRVLLFRNLRGGKFAEVGRGGGEGLSVARSLRGSATGDLDDDGDIDVVANSIDGEPLLLRNDGGNRAGHWLRVRLVGDPSRRCPRDATGSQVFLTAGGARQRGDVASGRSVMSQSDRRVHFGLGPATRVERLEVRWANGPTVAYEVPAIDAEIVIDQARGVVRAE